MNPQLSTQQSPERDHRSQSEEVAAPSGPAPGAQTLSDLAVAICANGSEISIAYSGELLQKFALVFAPVLHRCRSYDINSGPAGLPQSLRDLVSDPFNRNLAWGALAVAGIPKNLSDAQAHALMIALLPHLVHDDFIAQASILRVAMDAGARRDLDLYRALGEGCSVAPIAPEFLVLLTLPYCQLLCPNIRHDKALAMWSDVFVERASELSLQMIAGEAWMRVYRGEKSSYDHLLTTLCHARDRTGLAFLREFIDPSYAQEQSPSAPDVTERRLARKDFIQDFAAFTTLGVVSGISGAIISPTAGSIVACVGGAAYMLYALSRQKVKSSSETPHPGNEEFLNSPSLAFFAERLYTKLSAIAPVNPGAQELKEYMESNPRYAHLRDAP